MHLVEPPHPSWFLGHPLPRGERVVPRGKDSNRIVEPSPLAGEGGPQPALSPAGAGRVRRSGIRFRIYETTYLGNPSFAPRPVLFSQQPLEDFPRAALGQAFQEFDRLGNLKTAEVLPAVVQNLLLARARALPYSDERLRDLAPRVVRDSDHRALQYIRMLVDH